MKLLFANFVLNMKNFVTIFAAFVLVSCSAQRDPWQEMEKVLERISDPIFPDREYLITDYYNGDDSLYTAAIQSAVQTCSEEGGGHVIIPAGVWKTAPLRLLSGVDLHLCDGATLLFSDDIELFDIVHTHWEGIDCYNVQPLIYADGQENIAVTGRGVIDGNAEDATWFGRIINGELQPDGTYLEGRTLLYRWLDNETPLEERRLSTSKPARTQTISFIDCKNILVEDVTIHRAPFWLVHPVLCTNFTLRRVTMDSHFPNNDGCDPESCTDVLIEDCIFDTGDDCIAIKSGRNADGRRLGIPSENVIVRNCQMHDGHAAVAIGSEIAGGFRNLWVENCKMDSPELKRVIRIKSNPARGGFVSNVNVRNIEVGECRTAVLGIELDYAKVSDGPYPLDFSDITIENAVSHKSRYAVHVSGPCDPVSIRKLTVRNCRFEGVTEPDLCRIVAAEDVSFENVTINGKEYSWQ